MVGWTSVGGRTGGRRRAVSRAFSLSLSLSLSAISDGRIATGAAADAAAALDWTFDIVRRTAAAAALTVLQLFN